MKSPLEARRGIKNGMGIKQSDACPQEICFSAYREANTTTKMNMAIIIIIIMNVFLISCSILMFQIMKQGFIYCFFCLNVMKNKIILALLMIVLLGSFVSAVDEKVCGVYFTFKNCHNCEVTDPMVLQEWTLRHDDLVIIEYYFPSWTDENAYLLGLYAEEYKSSASVPRLFLSGSEVYAGRVQVPQAEEKIKGLGSNPCLLLDGAKSFNDLDLNELEGYPKIWANGRVLIRNNGGDVSNEFLKEILFTDDLEGLIESSDFDIEKIKGSPMPVAFGEIEFEKALVIEDSWILQYGIGIGGVAGDEDGTETGVIVLPFFGDIDTTKGSLFFLTMMIGLADGFNPCAFFILTFLLTAMIMAGSQDEEPAKKRKKIILVGGVFVLFSALIYFLAMGLWLNVFLHAKKIVLLTLVAGVVAVFAGVVNIKDYFAFQKGISLTLPKKEKSRFMDKVEKLTQVKSLWGLLIGAVIIAASVNLYELICTMGLPIVYIGILTARDLAGAGFYGYIALYNLFYILPLAVIVGIAVVTLGLKQFTKTNVQKLKLFSGFMALFLGGVLIFKPEWLESFIAAFGVLISAIVVALIVMGIWPLGVEKKEEGFCEKCVGEGCPSGI